VAVAEETCVVSVVKAEIASRTKRLGGKIFRRPQGRRLMGFFSKLFGFGGDAARIAELADEVERYADRFTNAKERDKAALARGYAQRIQRAKSLKLAEVLYAEFLAIIAKEDYELLRHQEDVLRTDHHANYSDNS
jgi:hypothetical protein